MSMMPWSSLPEPLKKLFNEVTCGPGSMWAPILQEAIQAHFNKTDKRHFFTCCVSNRKQCWEGFAESCWDFVHYQVKMCNGDPKEFRREGFQIGSPWHGDVIEAPILFLSSNPGITQNCLFPRWHVDEGNFTLGGKSNITIAYKDDDGNSVELPNEIAPEEGLYDFFTNRFQESWATKITAKGYINALLFKDRKLAGKRCGVSYWRGMHNFMEKFLIESGEKDKDKLSKYKKEYKNLGRMIMAPVLSAEIVPFGSQREIGVKNNDALLDYCWEKFTCPLLENCGARILVLVGSLVTDTFGRSLGLQNGTIKVGEPFFYENVASERYRSKNGEYLVVSVNHFSAREKDQNYKKAIEELLKSSDVCVKKSLKCAVDETWSLIDGKVTN